MVNKRSVDLKELVNKLIEALKTLIDKNKKTIKLIVPEDLKSVNCDPVLINEALENLISNAIYYSDEGSQEVSIAVEERADDYLVSIHNDGFINPEVAQRMRNFEKFTRGPDASKKQPSGSGLGLYITKRVIEASGGTLWFESDIENGTTFYLTITKK
jgi:signal transduction histidine kinase